jgi:hypothetical protein
MVEIPSPMIREQGGVIRYAWDVFIGLCATVSALIIPADLVLGLTDAAHVSIVA